MEMYFSASRGVSFSYFPKVALSDGRCPFIPFRIVVNVTIFSSRPM